MKIVDKYLHLLGQALGAAAPGKLTALETAKGAKPESVAALLAAYPECPKALAALLQRLDGSAPQSGPANAALYALGSDIQDYPYYLLSAAQMLQSSANTASVADIYGAYVESIDLDDAIDVDLPMGKWLRFAEGADGASQLFVDFDPLPGGVQGQIVRGLQNPDSYAVIADSFEEYLECLIDDRFDFLNAYNK